MKRRAETPRREPDPVEAVSPMAGVLDEVLADQPEVVDGEDAGLSTKDRLLQELEAKEDELKTRQQQREEEAEQGYLPKALRKYLDS